MPNNKLDYKILQREQAHELEAEVVELLRLGWKPIGGVAVTRDPDGESRTGMLYTQAMLKAAH